MIIAKAAKKKLKRFIMSNEVKEINQVYQLLKRLVKYGITALTVLCTAHCGLLLLGYDLLTVHVLLCSFLFILGLCLSQLFHLCWVHKACVVYTCTVVLCIVFKRYDIFFAFGISIETARLIMCVLGVLITALVLWKIQEKNC